MYGNALRTFLLLLTTAAGLPANAADVAHYFASSADSKPRGDAGMALSSEKVRLAADVALRAQDGGTQVLPKVSSTVALAPRIDLETRLDLAEWNSSNDPFDARFATRLRVQAPTPFLDELEGKFWRLPDGRTGRLLGLGFYQRIGDDHGSKRLTVRTRATVETASDTTHRVALETEFGGLTPRLSTGRGALRFRVVRDLGPSALDASSVAYDRSWTLPSTAKVAFNLGMQRSETTAGALLEPTAGISWRAGF